VNFGPLTVQLHCLQGFWKRPNCQFDAYRLVYVCVVERSDRPNHWCG